MTTRRVQFTAAAQTHVDREQTWWIQHRAYPEIFTDELEQAVALVAAHPGVGTIHRSRVPGVRRLYLRRVDLHLYYTVAPQAVIVRALWGARRGRTPNLAE